MKYVMPFSKIRIRDVPLVGGKTASLGEMLSIGLPVPDGFAITSDAYKFFIKENGLDKAIHDTIKGADLKRIRELKRAGSEVRSLIRSAPFPMVLERQILQSYRSLGSRFVAVRSSATAEDLPDASFAGEQESYLNVDEKNLLKRVRDCFASLFTDRAISYREDKKFDHFKVYLSAAVEKQIFSKASGVMFTIDPDSGHRNFIVINSSYGLGDYIVQGRVTPDEFLVFKKNGKLIEKRLGDKNVMEVRSIFGVRQKKISPGMQKTFSISDKEAEQLAAFAKRIEKHYGRAMDIEWAKDDMLYIIQARPETVHNAKKTFYEEYRLKGKGVLLAEGASVGRKIASGKVNIIRSVKKMSRFKKGDVLVTTTTDPDWEPIMKIASAIVTEQGGRTCFAGDTKILTNIGFMTMRHAHDRTKNGEKLVIFSYNPHNGNSEWKKILSTSKNSLDTINIAVSQTGNMKGNTITLTPDHRMYTYEKRSIVKKPISQLLENDEMLCVVDKLPDVPNKMDNTKLAYLLGAIATDGHVEIRYGKAKPRHGTVIFTQKDTEAKMNFISTVNSYFLDIFGKSMTPRTKFSSNYFRGRLIQGYAVDYRCHSLDIALQINKFMENLQNMALHFTEESALNFLAGVIDGDGTFHNNRISIYASKENVLRSVLLSCWKLGIVPQVTVNRGIHNVQILERLSDILSRTKRVKGGIREKHFGTKLFSARQIFSDIIDHVNYAGHIGTYIHDNRLMDARKIEKFIMPMATENEKLDISEIINSATRMTRVSFVEDAGEIDVYNIEVEADNELDHCYVVFTERYTPLLVSNSHAAIVSRELGIPAVVGSLGAIKKLSNGYSVTVDCSEEKGRVWKGALRFARTQHDIKKMPKTRTKIYVNIGEPQEAVDASLLPVDGVGLAREEFIISSSIGEHPLAMLKQKRESIFIDKLASGAAKIAASFYPRPVIIRFSDFKTNEYRNLKGGEKYEPHEENPMIGWRGASRYVSSYEPAFRLELKAIKKCLDELGLDNIKLMIPFCRTIDEARRIFEIVKSEKINCKLGAMAEIPSNVILAKEFSKYFSFFSIGSNDLTQLTLGVDRDNTKLAKEFDERNDAVKKLMQELIKTAHACRRPVGICGQAPSDYPDFAEFLVKNKIDSISVNPDVAVSTRLLVAKAEKK